jgi:hypothetical protein
MVEGLVGVMMPAYNAEHYISQAIDNIVTNLPLGSWLLLMTVLG